jgi:hypothetical protein
LESKITKRSDAASQALPPFERLESRQVSLRFRLIGFAEGMRQPVKSLGVVWVGLQSKFPVLNGLGKPSEVMRAKRTWHATPIVTE